MAAGDGGGAPPNTRIPLRVLLVEASEIDAEGVLGALRRGGYDPTGKRVETAPALTAALERQQWDVITCDWDMPHFSAPAVLALLQKHQVDLPIIIVSSRAGEEYAVTAMKAGAHDFVSKHNLARLCPAIARELAEVEVRRARQHAEAELKRLAAAVEMMAEGVCLIRVDDGVILNANRTFETMFGYGPGELRGQPVSTLNAPGTKSPEETATEIMVALRARGSWAGEVHNRKKDGTAFWCHATVSALADQEHGDLWVSINMDITEQKQAEASARTSEALLQAIAEGTSDAVYVKDTHGRYLLANAATARFVEKSIDEVLGKDDTALFAPTEAREVMQADHHVMASGVMQTFEEFVTSNGVARTFLSTKGPVRDAHGNVIGLFGIARDITERKRAETEARARLAELAHVLRVSSMGAMAAELAHELNQPLAAIVNYARGCVRHLQANAEESPSMSAALNEIAKQALRAGRIIHGLRKLVRKEVPQRAWANVNDLVREAVHLLEPEARVRQVAIRVNVTTALPTVCVDEIQVEQVLLNLLRNGLEAINEPEGGPREVSVQTALAAPESLIVSVSDTGTGLDLASIEKVFDPFFTTKTGGLGMGLAISRSIIESHGGRLWGIANPGAGATFCFTLPLGRPSHEPTGDRPTTVRPE